MHQIWPKLIILGTKWFFPGRGSSPFTTPHSIDAYGPVAPSLLKSWIRHYNVGIFITPKSHNILHRPTGQSYNKIHYSKYSWAYKGNSSNSVNNFLFVNWHIHGIFQNVAYRPTVAIQRIKQEVWPPGSADTVCPRPSVTLTFDRLTLKLVCGSHLRWGTFVPNLDTLGL